MITFSVVSTPRHHILGYILFSIWVLWHQTILDQQVLSFVPTTFSKRKETAFGMSWMRTQVFFYLQLTIPQTLKVLLNEWEAKMHLTTSFDFPHPTQLVERFNLFSEKWMNVMKRNGMMSSFYHSKKWLNDLKSEK